MDHETVADVEDPLLPTHEYRPRRDGSGALAQSHPDQFSDVDGQTGFGTCLTAPAYKPRHCCTQLNRDAAYSKAYYVAPDMWHMNMRGL